MSRSALRSLSAAALGIASVCTALAPEPAIAQRLQAVGASSSVGWATSEASKKVVSRLRALMADAASVRRGSEATAAYEVASRFSSPGTLEVDGLGRVHVYVYATDVGAGTIQLLERHGLDVEIVNADFNIVQGWIAIERLESLASEPVVVKIRPPSYGKRNVGPATTEGDATLRCAEARTAGFTGAGVKVGVISSGVAGLALSQAAGELPSVQVVSNFTGNDEGTAMLEIVHDCAPGAALAFASNSPGGLGTSLSLMQAVNALRDAGAHVIVDDIGLLGDPYFEDGPTALNDRTVGAQVLRISAAGNEARGHYQGTFKAGAFDPQVPGTRHDFGGGDTLLRFRVPGGVSARIVLQWANRFGQAADDYDLCVRHTDGTILACSAVTQNGNDDPLEAVLFSCALPGPCLGDIQISRFAGQARPLKLFCFDGCVLDQFAVDAGTVFGHPSVPEVLAVAAVSWSSPALVEDFSSRGPSLILFPATEERAKPDLAATDRVHTSRPGYKPFAGTSAAAPHVGGVAALLIQALGGVNDPAVLRQILRNTALDLGQPGPDSAFGFGLVDALAAVQSVAPPPGVALAAAILPGSRAVPAGGPATAFALIFASGTETATGCFIAPTNAPPGTAFSYQQTNAANQPIGAPNTPVDIPANDFRTFLFALTPSQPFPATELQFGFDCANTAPAPVTPGVNTFLLTSAAGPTPDVVAIAVAVGGIVTIPGTSGTGALAVASLNVGAGALIVVTADTGSAQLPLALTVCQTNPVTSQCINPAAPAASVTTQINTGETPTFAIFARAQGAIPFNPGVNRVFVRFRTQAGGTVGSTSVAVQTQ